MDEALRSIDKSLVALGRSTVLDRLAAGTNGARVRRMVGDLGLDSLDELERLYEWHDGTLASPPATLGELWLFPGFYLLSLDDACTNYRAFAPDERWRLGWLPVFADGGGDFYVVDLAGARGTVRRFRIDQTEHPVEFKSVSAMMHTLAAAFESGVFFLNASGILDVRDDEFADLAARLNPSVAWWTG